MARFFGKRGEVLGKSPGEMVYIGRNPSSETRIDELSYNANHLRESNNISITEIKHSAEDEILWLNVEGVSDADSMKSITGLFKLNPLIAADIMNTATRPKYVNFDSGLFISLKMLNYDEEKDRILSEQISLVVLQNQLITFQEAKGDVFNPIRERLNNESARIRNRDAGYLAYALIDALVDNYMTILHNIAEKIDGIEELLLEDPAPEVLKKIIFLKKELLYLGKSVKPAKEAIKNLIDKKPSLLENNNDFFIDLYSNITQVAEALELYKEITTEQQHTYDGHVNNRLNEIMKVLTIFSVIFLPLTIITGIYGTNFDFIPELHFKYGYLFLWGLLFLFAGIMILVFKKKKWF